MVVFPLTVAPILVGKDRSTKLVNDAIAGNRLIALVTQRPGVKQTTNPDDLYRVGTMAIIRQQIRAPDNSFRIVAQSMERVRIRTYERTEPYFVARVEWAPDEEAHGVEVEAL